MGSFLGHALPGCFFLGLGLWWLIQIYRRYFRCLYVDSTYCSTPSFAVDVSSRHRQVQMECYVGIFLCIGGMVMELIIAPNRPGYSFHVGSVNTQHATMYIFFLILCVTILVTNRMNIMTSTGNQVKGCSRKSTPRGLDVQYGCLLLAFFMEGLVFHFHITGRAGPDILTHTLLIYAIAGCVGATFLEMTHKHKVMPAICRAFCTILQGTWLWQVGFFIYNPFKGYAWHSPYDDHLSAAMQNDADENQSMHETTMLIVCTYAWHVAVILVTTLSMGLFFSRLYRDQTKMETMRLLGDDPLLSEYSNNADNDDEI